MFNCCDFIAEQNTVRKHGEIQLAHCEVIDSKIIFRNYDA